MVCCATARSRDFGDVREVLCDGKSVGYGSCEGGRLMVEEVGRGGVLGFFSSARGYFGVDSGN